MMNTESTDKAATKTAHSAGLESGAAAGYVATMQIYARVSADYDVAKRTRTKILAPHDTIKEVMIWAETQRRGTMGTTDVVITPAT